MSKKGLLRINMLAILAILTFSTVIPAFSFADPLGANGADWQFVNGDSWAGNYSPQTQIDASNVDELEVKWIFPLADNSNVPAGISILSPGAGSNTPPIVIDGTVIVQTNFQRLIAVDALNGAQLWSHDYTTNLTDAADRLPINYGSAFLLQHIHGIRVWPAGNAVLVSGLACDFYGVDIDTGEETFHAIDLCLDIPGNQYDISQGSLVTTNIGTYDAGNMFITVLPGVLHSGYSGTGDFRHTTLGVDMTTLEIIWRTYSFPPHSVLSKDWALQECDIGWFRDIPCSTVEAQALENLEWDWAQVGEPPAMTAGVTANWGQMIVDEDTGIIYTQTGNQGPYTYIGQTPGPRLYGSTIMALDASTGQRLWWSQPMPRDPYDYDCNWGGFLYDSPTYGKIYTKGCKEGRLHILDAATGEPIMLIDVVDEQYARGQITLAGTLEFPEGGIKYRTMDPLNNYDMRIMTQPADSPYCGDPCYLYTSFYNGIFGTDPSFNRATGIMYHYTQAAITCLAVVPDPPWEVGQSLGPGCSTGGATTNTTIVARDMVTGEEIWSWYYDVGVVRSHIVTTSNIIWTGFGDGYMRFFHAETGELLREINLGANMGQIGTTTGKDSEGNQKIFGLLITGSAFGQSTPGTLIALGLNNRAQQAAETVTITSTSRTTVTSTSTSISTTTATTTTTATSVSTTVSTTVVDGTTTTVTVDVTETEEVGLSSTITYAAVAVAVIAIIGAAVIYTRKS